MVILVVAILIKLVIMFSEPGCLRGIGKNLYFLWRLTQDGPIGG